MLKQTCFDTCGTSFRGTKTHRQIKTASIHGNFIQMQNSKLDLFKSSLPSLDSFLVKLQLKLEASLPASSPILKLSTKDRQDMLAWLDIQRNSEVLAKTDKKIAEKLRNQRLTEKAAKQVSQLTQFRNARAFRF